MHPGRVEEMEAWGVFVSSIEDSEENGPVGRAVAGDSADRTTVDVLVDSVFSSTEDDGLPVTCNGGARGTGGSFKLRVRRGVMDVLPVVDSVFSSTEDDGPMRGTSGSCNSRSIKSSRGSRNTGSIMSSSICDGGDGPDGWDSDGPDR